MRGSRISMSSVQRLDRPTSNSLSYVDTSPHQQFSSHPTDLSQIADEERKIAVLYDMLDEQDATNRDSKGIPFTVRSIRIWCLLLPSASLFALEFAFCSHGTLRYMIC
jgi:hypothetical protein